MKKLEKELRIAYGMRYILLHLMEAYNPDSMDQEFIEEKFDTIMISLYDHNHRRLSGNWLSNQDNYEHYGEDRLSQNCKGYMFRNDYACRFWDGILEDPYENAPIKVPFDKSIEERMCEYCDMSRLNIPHFMWDATMLFNKIRFIRVAFRNSTVTSEGVTLTTERGYEFDPVGSRHIKSFTERWYDDGYEYLYDGYDDCDEDDLDYDYE